MIKHMGTIWDLRTKASAKFEDTEHCGDYRYIFRVDALCFTAEDKNRFDHLVEQIEAAMNMHS